MDFLPGLRLVLFSPKHMSLAHITALNEIVELCMRNNASSWQTPKQTLTGKEGEALDMKNTLLLFQLCVSYQGCICFASPINISDKTWVRLAQRERGSERRKLLAGRFLKIQYKQTLARSRNNRPLGPHTAYRLLVLMEINISRLEWRQLLEPMQSQAW